MYSGIWRHWLKSLYTAQYRPLQQSESFWQLVSYTHLQPVLFPLLGALDTVGLAIAGLADGMVTGV